MVNNNFTCTCLRFMMCICVDEYVILKNHGTNFAKCKPLISHLWCFVTEGEKKINDFVSYKFCYIHDIYITHLYIIANINIRHTVISWIEEIWEPQHWFSLHTFKLGYEEIHDAFITYVGLVKTFAVCKAGIKRASGGSVSGVIVHNYIETQKTH